jgi:hypothetical protein
MAVAERLWSQRLKQCGQISTTVGISRPLAWSEQRDDAEFIHPLVSHASSATGCLNRCRHQAKAMTLNFKSSIPVTDRNPYRRVLLARARTREYYSLPNPVVSAGRCLPTPSGPRFPPRGCDRLDVTDFLDPARASPSNSRWPPAQQMPPKLLRRSCSAPPRKRKNPLVSGGF